jgi:hypothetical protein
MKLAEGVFYIQESSFRDIKNALQDRTAAERKFRAYQVLEVNREKGE